MKIEINKQNASRLINCGPVVLVTSGYKDKRNITTCAWSMPLSKGPALLGVALAKKHFSSELINLSLQFIVNIPEWKLLDKVMACGSISGRNMDKFKENGFTAEKAHSLSDAPKIAECAASVECLLVEAKEAGDHYLFIGEIVYAEAENSLFVNDFWDTEKAELIFHLGSKFFFKSSPYMEFKK
ncbi:MAG: flavin reductase family protein [Candidatus Omnitrophica bacterium]|nr:flavin reductase family protein [Candidatus Omnitrophota bacterium]